MNDEEMREFTKSVKEYKKIHRGDSVKKILSFAGKMMPKGIRHPDSLVTNMHLYSPRVKHKGKTRLF